MTSTALAVAMLPAVLGATGCFDAHSVDQGPWVIDDFEDGDLNPADRNFGAWVCYTYPQPSQYLPVLDSGYQSAFSLALDFTVVNPASGTNDNAGAGVQTLTAAVPEDFSRFNKMVFSSKSVPGVSASPGVIKFAVHLGCSTVSLDDGTTPGDVFVLLPFVVPSAVPPDWGDPVQLPMANFESPSYLSAHPVDPATCIRHVDSIQFDAEPQLLEGQSTMGRLDIDEINFQ